MKCKFEHDGDCCNCGSPQYMCKCNSKICNSAAPMTNADCIRAMSDEELAELVGEFGSCEKCGFSVGWRCQPDRQDYSDSEKCVEGRKRWLKQPAGGEQHE